jgi:hypothetical protein
LNFGKLKAAQKTKLRAYFKEIIVDDYWQATFPDMVVKNVQLIDARTLKYTMGFRSFNWHLNTKDLRKLREDDFASFTKLQHPLPKSLGGKLAGKKLIIKSIKLSLREQSVVVTFE